MLLCVALAWIVALGNDRAGAADEPLVPTPSAAAGQEPIGDSAWEDYSGEGMIGDGCDVCGDCGCEPACFVGPSGRFWLRADYMLWWTKGSRLPPLVTTSTNIEDGGRLGQPTTSVLVGNSWINGGSRSNVRLTFGFWFDCGQTVGMEFDLFSLGESMKNYHLSCIDESLLFRPYYDVATGGTPAAQMVCYPDMITGSVDVRGRNYFHSGGLRVRFNLCCHDCCCCECSECSCYADDCCGETCGGYPSDFNFLKLSRYRIDLIGGYRNFRLDDSLRIREDLISTDPGGDVPVGTTFDIEDSFRTRNEFHGGELGLVAQIDRGPWSLELLAKIAFGNNERIVTINGSTVVTTPEGTVASHTGGLLALPTNIGRYYDDEFVVIPQVGLELGYQVNCNLRAYVGYNFLYWAEVTRAADQIDMGVNTTQLPPGELAGPARPAFTLHDTDFWAQGLNFGLELRY